MGKIIKGFWDCQYCGRTKIGADKQDCPYCGRARDKDFEPYIDEDNIEYLSEEEAAKVNRNPDWFCDFCGQYNPDSLEVCRHCGAARLASNSNYFEVRAQMEAQARSEKAENMARMDETLSLSDEWEQCNGATFGGETNSRQFIENDAPAEPSVFKKVKTFFKGHSLRDFAPHIGIATLLVSFILLMVFLLTPKEMEVSVSGVAWEYNINIERFQTVSESGWTLPYGARLRYTQEEYYGRERVVDYYETKTRTTGGGRKNLGNGYFEELETQTETYTEAVYKYVDVYKDKYYYDIDRWIYERSVTTGGTDKSPYWGDANLISNERISSKSESYTITGRNEDEKDVTISLSYEDWMKVEIDRVVKLRVVLGHGEIIE